MLAAGSSHASGFLHRVAHGPHAIGVLLIERGQRVRRDSQVGLDGASAISGIGRAVLATDVTLLDLLQREKESNSKNQEGTN